MASLGLDLKLRMGMQLVMTPQLQLAIRLLQMSSLELEEYLQEELEKNPLLDREEDGDDRDAERGGTEDPTPYPDLDADAEGIFPAPEEREVASTPENDALSEELAVDANWSDVYDDGVNNQAGNYEGPAGGEAPSLESILTRSDSLSDHLLWQLGVTARSDRERMLGMVIIDAVDENGYLATTLPALAESVAATLPEIEAALAMIQGFDPVGVAARSLSECLLLQLRVMRLDFPPYNQLVLHLEDLAKRDYRKLCRLLKLEEEELAEAITTLQSLNPKPGLAFSNDQTTYIIPDVFVRRQGDLWLVEINPDTVPRLRVNRYYQDAATRAPSADDRRFLADNARSAHWLIKSLEQRTRTILRVAESIFRVQQDFLEKGAEYMKPLILKEIADDIGVHESTISRVTSNKYVHTPRGIFEFKYFFSSALAAPGGGESHSAEAVKFKIRKLMENESSRHPYSDEKLVQMLQEQGIEVARRTVAKYREAMGIPPSSRRKRLSQEAF